MRSPRFEYIRNPSAMAQALIRQQRAVRAAQPTMFAVGPERSEERSDGTTARVRTPATAVVTPPSSLMSRYMRDDGGGR